MRLSLLVLLLLLSHESLSCNCLPAQPAQRKIVAQSLTQSFINRTTAKLCADASVLGFLKGTKLSMEEALSIYNTKTSETYFRDINSALKSPSRFSEVDLKKHIDSASVIVAGLSKLPLYTGPVIRYETQIKEAFSHHKVGEVIQQKEFTASVLANSESNDGGADVKILINSKTGRNIMLLTPSRKDAEVIFLPGTRFKIDKIKDTAGGYLEIEWTEL